MQKYSENNRIQKPRFFCILIFKIVGCDAVENYIFLRDS